MDRGALPLLGKRRLLSKERAEGGHATWIHFVYIPKVSGISLRNAFPIRIYLTPPPPSGPLLPGRLSSLPSSSHFCSGGGREKESDNLILQWPPWVRALTLDLETTAPAEYFLALPPPLPPSPIF